MVTFNFLISLSTYPGCHFSFELISGVLLKNNLLVIGGTGFPFAEVRNNSLYCCNLKTLEWSVLKCSGTFPNKVYGHVSIWLKKPANISKHG